MNKNKKIGIVLGIVLILGAVFFLSTNILTGEKGSKEIKITIVNVVEDKTIIENKSFKTDKDTLGDFLVERKDEFKANISEDDSYGRYIIGLYGYDTEDVSKGPWWLYSYTSKSQNIDFKVGEAPGIDQIKLNDGDTFRFEFKDTF